jgi:mannose/cellobiose epimerase-like protein (N-acyl-D-glucosamine 2-epimerase family)
MKKRILLSAFTLMSVFSFPVNGQYVPSSPYLQNPSLIIGHIDTTANFWLQTYDYAVGGFFTNIDKYGNVLTSWGTNKNMLTQSRNAYGMVRAFMVTGDTTYLNLARLALDWMYEKAWDSSYNGWIQKLDINGNPVNPTDDKTAFYQHYALLGIIAVYEATGDTTAFNWLMRGFNHLENIYWDNRINYLGYYDKADYTNQNIWDKSFNATVDAITTHLLYLYLLSEDTGYRLRLEELAVEVIDHMVASMPQQAIGFVERYNSEWNWDNSELMTVMGHVLKAGWCLARIYHLFPDTAYISAAETLINEVWTKGYDHEYFGPYKDFNRVTGEMLLWGLSDTTKAWWQMEQAVTAGLQMFDITGESLYLEMADETLLFYMTHFVDYQYGEVYADRTRYGGLAWNEAKGNEWKAAYHSIELGYYIYLYGSLFYSKEPVTLHYKYEPVNYDRDFLLTPLAIADSDLIITQVLKDGQTYTNYDPVDRVLMLPAGESGHFEVTYETTVTQIASNRQLELNNFRLYQNYPNPFNPTTKIKYNVPPAITSFKNSELVKLKVYDILGYEIATLVDEQKSAGSYEVEFDASHLSSGIYFYTLTSGDFTETKKMMLIK